MPLPYGAIRIHLYNASNVLMPRGSMEKESIGQYLKERLESAYQSWTDENYGDNPTEDMLLQYLQRNLMNEASSAWHEFFIENIKLE